MTNSFSNGKTVLIRDATSGISKAVAKLLLQEDALVHNSWQYNQK